MGATAPLCRRQAAFKGTRMPALDKHDTPLPTTTVKWRWPSIHPDGRKYVVGAAAITFFAFLLHVHVIDWMLAGVTIWVASFFRDPIRTTPDGDKLIVAPADGLITMIARVAPPPELRGPEALAEGAHLRVVRGQHVGEERDEEQQAEEGGRDDRKALAADAADGAQAPARGQRRGPGAVHRANRMRGSITA